MREKSLKRFRGKTYQLQYAERLRTFIEKRLNWSQVDVDFIELTGGLIDVEQYCDDNEIQMI